MSLKNRIKSFFGKGKENIDGSEWNWEKWKTTEGFPISNDLMKWIIGQEEAIAECKLCLDEMIHRLNCMKRDEWWKNWENPELEKPKAKDFIAPTPSLLLLGKHGTGKSLLGRALAMHLTELYKKHNVEMYDVVSWKNNAIPSEPRISIMPTPIGRETVIKEKKKASRKGFFKRIGLKLAAGISAVIGSFALFVGMYQWFAPWITNAMTAYGLPVQVLYNNFFDYSMAVIAGVLPFFALGTGMLMSAVMIMFFGIFRSGMGGSGRSGIGGAEATSAPKLIVDNSEGKAKFVDATGHSSAQLFGSIAWDPYQTGGLGTPEHQRVTAGDVHRAFMGILYIDEIKNLHPEEAVTLLTVLEDGQLPVTMRGSSHGANTAAMAVATEAVPCTTFFVAAGNMDSIPMIHHALMDRIQGYGKVVHMNEEMEDSIENRRKYVQFICQEIDRFDLFPFSREACIEVIDEARRKARKGKLTCIFRPMISVIKTAGLLARNEGGKRVEEKHVKEAIEKHCKSVQRQAMEKQIKKQKLYQILDINGKPKVGQIHALAIGVDRQSREKIGSVFLVKASAIRKNKTNYFDVTGINEDRGAWIQNSVSKVQHILETYVKKLRPIGVQIDFAQQNNVDGPSAGVAMFVTALSAIENKPLRQDTAVTGDINVPIGNDVIVTPVGGIYEKIKAAEQIGFKRVLIPKRNLEVDIVLSDFKIKVIGCETLNDYIKELFADDN